MSSTINYENKDIFLFEIIDNSTEKTNKKCALANATHSLNIWARFAKNRKEFPEYASLKKQMAIDISSLGDNKNPWLSLVLLKDKKDQLQAIASVSEEKNILYVNTLLSAAWNIYPSWIQSNKRVTGAGTSLMQKICEIAKQKLKSRVEVDATKSAARFYKNHLQWTESPIEQNRFFFSLDGSIPEQLDI
jgi:hypothetical protein